MKLIFFFRWITSSSTSKFFTSYSASFNSCIIDGRLATQTSPGSCIRRTSLPLLAVSPALHTVEGMEGENECNRPFDEPMNLIFINNEVA